MHHLLPGEAESVAGLILRDLTNLLRQYLEAAGKQTDYKSVKIYQCMAMASQS